ncbi:MAG: CbiQ family ECF transporter T component [Bryobacteraceae bacterium]
MHHVVLERWSRGASFVHARDARVKVLVLLAYLVALATTAPITFAAATCYAALVAAATVAARLPLAGLALRAAAVLPFAGTFALFSILAGDGGRAASLVSKSYLSAAAVLVLAGTTPLPKLVRGLESLGVPRFLTLVIQFLYRYLFVISEQAQHMRLAALARGGGQLRFTHAAGAAATLFGRSYARAEGIHGAMLARGFHGRMELLAEPRLGTADVLFLAAGLAAAMALRLAMGAVG